MFFLFFKPWKVFLYIFYILLISILIEFHYRFCILLSITVYLILGAIAVRCLTQWDMPIIMVRQEVASVPRTLIILWVILTADLGWLQLAFHPLVSFLHYPQVSMIWLQILNLHMEKVTAQMMKIQIRKYTYCTEWISLLFAILFRNMIFNNHFLLKSLMKVFRMWSIDKLNS